MQNQFEQPEREFRIRARQQRNFLTGGEGYILSNYALFSGGKGNML